MFRLYDLLVMRDTIFGEASGESFDGQKAVGHTILNRVALSDGHRDVTIAAACLRPWQFSCWNKDGPNLDRIMQTSDSDTAMISCLHAAVEAIEEHRRGEDLTHGATHYCTKYVDPEWAHGAEPLCEIDHHVFYKVAL